MRLRASMLNRKTLCLLLAASGGMSPTPGHAARVEPVVSAAVDGAGIRTAPAFLGSGVQAWDIALPTVEADLAPAGGGVAKTGVVFSLPVPVVASQLAWEPVAGGHVARVHVSSGQAKRLRFHLAFPGGPRPIHCLVRGTLDSSPVEGSTLPGNGLWLPVTNGSEADLEMFVGQAIPPGKLDVRVDAVNIIIADVGSGDVEGIVAASLGYAEQQQYDLACWSTDPSYQGLSQAAAATAKVNFIQNGNSYTCSGTLLADRGGTKVPWFATANHCIPNQATADTASFEWFLQATGCNGSAQDPRYAQTDGGALLLYTDVRLEPSFLKLNRPPPAGVSFAGWDDGVHVGQRVWGVHHPSGDHTMVNLGEVKALLRAEIDTSKSVSHLFDEVVFSHGGIEPGSSGSGLFHVADGSAYWMGTLFGGPSSDYQIASYSHLPSYYNAIRKWLDNTSATPTFVRFTASPPTVDYLGSTTLAWSSENAAACSAVTSDGWSGAVALSGSLALPMRTTTTYTLTCEGLLGQAAQAVTVTVAPAPAKLACLFDWAERHYPDLFSPASANQFSDPYTYRYYQNTQSYVGVSSLDNHVYYLNPAGVLSDVGELSGWLTTSGCW